MDTCNYDTSACTKCGDGSVDGDEECDGSNLGGVTCTSLGFDGGDLTCNATTCELDTSSCSTCGDGVVSSVEQCDGSNLNGQDCITLGHTSGTLACDPATCQFDIADCTFPGTYCQEECTGTEDCYPGLGLECVNQRCVTPAPACTSDVMCREYLSGWITACASQDECLSHQACVAVSDGSGKCAALDTELNCGGLGYDAISMPEIGGGGDVLVCGRANAACYQGQGCYLPCQEDDECADPLPLCRGDGLCVACLSHDDCTAGKSQCMPHGSCGCADSTECNPEIDNGSVCVTDLGYCGCADDTECAGGAWDTCYDGICGCSDVSVCTEQLHPGTTMVCEPY
jgi:hypothetical protein